MENKNSNTGPPKLMLKFFRWFCHPDLVSAIEGDLIELFNERKVVQGKRIARWKFCADVLFLLRPAIVRPSDGLHELNQYTMFKNYFKVGVRNILKYKVFSFINIFGLALAMSVGMLIILMLADQNRYDAFHEKKDRIYRLLSHYTGTRMPYATTPYPLAKALRDETSVTEETTNLMPGPGGEATYNKHMTEMRGYFAEPSFFRVFSFELESGDKSSALSSANTIVISSAIRKKLFGAEDPIGKTIEFSDRQLPFPQDHANIASTPVSWGSFTVTGVIDETRYKSHLKFDVLMSAATMQRLQRESKWPDRSNDWEFFYQGYTYALLLPGKTQEEMQSVLGRIIAQRSKDFKSVETKGFNIQSQRMDEIQTNLMANDTNDRLPRIGYWFLIILASVILVSACLNYTNLSIARALTRAKEIGIRKVTGAFRLDLVFQFLSESIVTTLLAMCLSVLMLMGIRPAFKGLWVNQFLNFELPDTFPVYGMFIGFALLIGCIAGFFPALRLSGYQPIRALKNLENKGRGGLGMRKVLTVTQFVISLFFITTSILIFRQFNYFMEFDYGFNSKNVINVDLQGAPYRKVVNAFASVGGIKSIGANDIIPATGRNNGGEIKMTGKGEEYTNVGFLDINNHFIEALEINIKAGRNFPEETDSVSKYIVVNEALVKALGFKNNDAIIGQSIENKYDHIPREVIGVTEDYRYNLLINRHEVDPLIMYNDPRNYAVVCLKLATGNSTAALAQLEKQWKVIDPIHPFRYRFYDAQIAATHQGIFDLVAVIGFIAVLAITIACLGLLGMATYTSERRKKEVGIRKVLGAEDFGIVLLLSKEFLRVLLIAVLIAAPMSYFVNNLWLHTLPTRVEFGYQTIIMGTFILMGLGLLTVGSQTFRAARNKPVDALKME